jgi:hypothetical protein
VKIILKSNSDVQVKFTNNKIRSPSWLLCNVGSLKTDVLGLPIGPIFKDQVSKENSSSYSYSS